MISANQIKVNEMARACGKHGREVKVRNVQERDHLEEPPIDGMIFKWMI